MRIPRQVLRDTVTLERFGGSGAMGPLYGAPETLRASFQGTARATSSSDGAVLAVTAAVFIRPEDGPVRPESRVTRSDGTRYRVVECYPMPDERRPSYYSLVCEKFATGYSGSGSGS